MVNINPNNSTNMKRLYISITVLVAASMLNMSCSNSDDELTNPNMGIKSMIIGAPVISSEAASTRGTFIDNDGLTMEWASGDKIYVTPFKGASYNRQNGSSTWSTTGSGATATFTSSDDIDDLPNDCSYVISIGCNLTNKTYAYWKTEEINNILNQGQGGNGSTTHLKNYYRAYLLNVNTYNSPTFNQTWATAHKGPSTAYGTSNPASAEQGLFLQSACLKIKLTLPQYSSLATTIKKLVLTASSNIFFTRADHSDGGVNSNTLRFSSIKTFGGDTADKDLIGYIILPPATWTIPNNTTMNLQVFYGDGDSDYIVKTITFTSEKTVAAGKLGVLTINRNNWKTSVGANIP